MVIHSYHGEWEESWKPIQGLGLRIPMVPKKVFDQALVGWTKPLVALLGYTPSSQLALLPKPARRCKQQGTCPLYRKQDCTILAKGLPWCFEPEGFNGPTIPLAKELIDLWRAGVYVIAVDEP